MTGNRREEFHVGYLDKTPPGIRRFVRRAALGLVALAAALGLGLALLLERFDEGVFEYGTVREYSGELLVDPHPRLVTADGPAEGYLLVGIGKHGLDANEASGPPRTVSPSREIELAGTLIRNPEAAMLEVHSLEFPEGAPEAGAGIEPGVPAGPAIRGPRLGGGSAGPESGPGPAPVAATGVSGSAGLESGTNPPPESPTSVIRVHGHTLRGEIVDTKCYLGAMKPGRGKPHRDCASLCIRGGIPAALLVRTKSGERRLVHLLDLQGQPLGREVLDWVGEPVEATGTLRRRGDRVLLTTFVIGPMRASAPTVVLPGRANPPPTAGSP